MEDKKVKNNIVRRDETRDKLKKEKGEEISEKE